MNETIHLLLPDGRQAPYAEAQVRQWWAQGQLPPETMCWKEGMAQWEPLSQLLGPSPHATVSTPPYASPYPTAPASPPTTYPQQYGASGYYGQTGYTTQPARPVAFFVHDPVGLTTLLKVMLSVSLVIGVLGMGSNWMEYQILQSGAFTQAEGDANDIRQGLIALMHLGWYILTVIVFGMWIYRANKNVRGFGAQNLDFTPGWAVGFYFIPFLNLVRPYQAMKEIWQASSNPYRWVAETTPPLLGVWSALWLLSNFLGQAILRVSLHAETIDALLQSTTLSLVSDVVDIALCIAALLLVSRILEMQLRVVGRKP